MTARWATKGASINAGNPTKVTTMGNAPNLSLVFINCNNNWAS